MLKFISNWVRLVVYFFSSFAFYFGSIDLFNDLVIDRIRADMQVQTLIKKFHVGNDMKLFSEEHEVFSISLMPVDGREVEESFLAGKVGKFEPQGKKRVYLRFSFSVSDSASLAHTNLLLAQCSNWNGVLQLKCSS
jgi:hypothetical protein